MRAAEIKYSYTVRKEQADPKNTVYLHLTISTSAASINTVLIIPQNN